MKNSAVLLVSLALCSSAATGATFINTDVADGAEITLPVADAYNKVAPSGSAFNQYLFEKNGTLKLTGFGAEATLNVLIFATNGTVTVDLSEFAFDDASSKVLNLPAGAYCGETGALKITGANDICVGNPRSESAVANFSSLELDAGATLCFKDYVAFHLLPPRSQVPWQIDSMTRAYQVGQDVLKDIYADGKLIFPGREISFRGDDPVTDVTISDGGTQTLQITSYGSYNPELAFTDGVKRLVPYSWYGQRRTVTCDINLTHRNSSYSDSLRGTKFRGDLSVGGTLNFTGTRASGSDGIEFFGSVEAGSKVTAKMDADANKPGREVSFHGAAFTNGNAQLDFQAQGATNTTFTFTAMSGEGTHSRFKTAAFGGTDANGKRAVFVIEAGRSVTLGEVTAGEVTVRGAGTLLLGGISSTSARVFVESGVTVAKDAEFPGTFYSRTEPDGSLTCFGLEDGVLDLNTYDPEVPITVYSGDVRGSTNGTCAQVTVAGDGVRLVSSGAGWDDDGHILLWTDASRLETAENVYVPEGATAGAGPALVGEYGYTTNFTSPTSIQKGYDKYFVERWKDWRGGEHKNEFYNNRMYSTKKDGVVQTQFWDSVYMEARRNGGPNDMPYLDNITNTSSRLPLATGLRPKFITLVFGSFGNGGAGLLADNNTPRVYGRDKSDWRNPIMTNNFVKTWVNGVLVDPTQTGFNGKWQVISLQPTNDVNRYAITGIGYNYASAGAGVSDCGGQAYAEIIMYDRVPTEEQRIAAELHLAEKWGIADYQSDKATELFDLHGSGSVALAGRKARVKGDFGGELELQGNELELDGTASDMTVTGRGRVSALARDAVPGFADDFDGEIAFGFTPWTFTVCPNEGVVDDAIDVSPAKLRVPSDTISIAPTARGTRSMCTVRALTCGGFIGTPNWQVEDLGFPRFRLSADGTGFSLSLSGGMLMLLR